MEKGDPKARVTSAYDNSNDEIVAFLPKIWKEAEYCIGKLYTIRVIFTASDCNAEQVTSIMIYGRT